MRIMQGMQVRVVNVFILRVTGQDLAESRVMNRTASPHLPPTSPLLPRPLSLFPSSSTSSPVISPSHPYRRTAVRKACRCQLHEISSDASRTARTREGFSPCSRMAALGRVALRRASTILSQPDAFLRRGGCHKWCDSDLRDVGKRSFSFFRKRRLPLAGLASVISV